MKKLIAALLVLFFIHGQSIARAGTFDLNSRFGELAIDVSNSKLSADELLEKSKAAVTEARNSGMTEEEFVAKLSEKMSLGLTQEEIRTSLEEIRSNPTQEKVQDIANKLTQKQNGDKFIQVLITFALLSLLWVGIFFILAAPYPR